MEIVIKIIVVFAVALLLRTTSKKIMENVKKVCMECGEVMEIVDIRQNWSRLKCPKCKTGRFQTNT